MSALNPLAEQITVPLYTLFVLALLCPKQLNKIVTVIQQKRK